MSQKLACLLGLTFALACGGTTEGSNPNGNGGTDPGGSNAGGTNSGGTHSGGTSNAGSHSGGTIVTAGAGGIETGGTGGFGGTLLGGAGGAGGGTYDPRCPPHQPMGECSVPPAVTCQYSYFTHCLCYDTPNMFQLCQQVDPSCTAATAGAPAMGGAPAPAPSEGGTGGVTAKVALPPQQKCMCAPFPPAAGGTGGASDAMSSGTWTCTVGF